VGKWPYTLARWRNPALSRRLAALVPALRPEMVFFHSLHVATHCDVVAGCARVLRQQNAESLWMARWAAGRREPERSYARFQAARLRGVEARLCEAMDLVLAIQPDERDYLRALAPRARVEEVSVASDLGLLRPRPRTERAQVLVVGSFAWPERRGRGALRARRLAARAHALPGARLRLVGKQCPPRLASLALAVGAEVAGYVPSIATSWRAPT